MSIGPFRNGNAHCPAQYAQSTVNTVTACLYALAEPKLVGAIDRQTIIRLVLYVPEYGNQHPAVLDSESIINFIGFCTRLQSWFA